MLSKQLTCTASCISTPSNTTELTVSNSRLTSWLPANLGSNVMESKPIRPQFLNLKGMWVGLTPVRSSSKRRLRQDSIITLRTWKETLKQKKRNEIWVVGVRTAVLCLIYMFGLFVQSWHTLTYKDYCYTYHTSYVRQPWDLGETSRKQLETINISCIVLVLKEWQEWS